MLQTSPSGIDTIRERLRQEITEEIRKNVLTEIERVSTLINEVTHEIEVMVSDPSVELSRIMKKRAEQIELQAYLAGLRYASASTRCKHLDTSGPSMAALGPSMGAQSDRLSTDCDEHR